MTTEPTRPCGTCGMPCTPGEYHPYAACLMFKACHNSETVRANLDAVRGQPSGAGEVVAWESTTLGYTKYLTQSRYEMFSPAARAWYKPYKCSNCAAPQTPQAVPPAGREPTIQWPKERDVGRIGDMSPGNFLRVGLDSDNDAYVSVCDEEGMGSVEFCVPGAGGGKSSRTRLALIALMVAIEADNVEDPGRDWWARRMGGIKGKEAGNAET